MKLVMAAGWDRNTANLFARAAIAGWGSYERALRHVNVRRRKPTAAWCSCYYGLDMFAEADKLSNMVTAALASALDVPTGALRGAGF